MEWTFGVVKWLGLILGPATLGLTLPGLLRNKMRSGGFRLPGVAIELAQNVGEFSAIVRDTKGNAQTFRQNLWIDQLVVVPLYVLLFVAQGIRLASGGPALQLVGALAILTAFLAGLADTVENLQTLQALADWKEKVLGEARIDRIRRASLVKWGLIALELVLLSAYSIKGGWFMLAGGLHAMSGLAMAWGVFRQRAWIEWGFCLMGPAWIAAAAALMLGT